MENYDDMFIPTDANECAKYYGKQLPYISTDTEYDYGNNNDCLEAYGDMPQNQRVCQHQMPQPNMIQPPNKCQQHNPCKNHYNPINDRRYFDEYNGENNGFDEQNYDNRINDNRINDNRINITDEYLLDYLLKRYKLDKQKLILMLTKTSENEYKFYVMNKFYKEHKKIERKPFKEQYNAFKLWNCSDVHITREDFENFYELNKKD